jgi:hypothetical protein
VRALLRYAFSLRVLGSIHVSGKNIAVSTRSPQNANSFDQIGFSSMDSCDFPRADIQQANPLGLYVTNSGRELKTWLEIWSRHP